MLPKTKTLILSNTSKIILLLLFLLTSDKTHKHEKHPTKLTAWSCSFWEGCGGGLAGLRSAGNLNWHALVAASLQGKKTINLWDTCNIAHLDLVLLTGPAAPNFKILTHTKTLILSVAFDCTCFAFPADWLSGD